MTSLPEKDPVPIALRRSGQFSRPCPPWGTTPGPRPDRLSCGRCAGPRAKSSTASVDNLPNARPSMRWVADRVGCRRQTIGDLEAGRNVSLYTVFAALAALDKGLEIIDSRIDMDHIKAFLDDDD